MRLPPRARRRYPRRRPPILASPRRRFRYPYPPLSTRRRCLRWRRETGGVRARRE